MRPCSRRLIAPSAGAAPVARVNGVLLNTPSEWLDETLRQRA